MSRAQNGAVALQAAKNQVAVASIGFGVGAILTVLAIGVLILLVWGLFVGVSTVFAVVLGGIATYCVVRKHWGAAVILGLAALFLVFADPFAMTVYDAGLSMGVDRGQ